MLSIDEEARLRFQSDWLAGKTAKLSIREYLPGSDSASFLGTLEELVCIDLAFRWKQSKAQAGEANRTVTGNESIVPTRVEDYVREFPELKHGDVLRRLVEHEIVTRMQCGFVVESSEIRSRFPSVRVDESLFQHEAETQEDMAASSRTGSRASFPIQFGGYVLTAQLGRGGMGAVYRARQPSAGREVAIKIADVSSLTGANRGVLAARFETEAHAASSLNHDHIVPIYDVGNVDDQPYYTMRLVEGGDLGAMSKEEPLAPRRAAHYMLGIARGIAAAHARGMLHRDIKPHNILVDASSDRAMLTDFGLARFMIDDSGLTQTGQFLGTPSYMSPEQIRDASRIDERADLYSLGATLYQLLTGKPPFKAADPHETLRQVMRDDPVAPRQLNSGIPLELDTICLKCLEKEPAARYATADDLADDLQRFLDGRPILAKPVSLVKKFAKWCLRNRNLAAAMGLAVLGITTGLVASLVGWRMTVRQMRTTQDYAMAGNAILDTVYTRVSDEPVLTTPDAAPLRQFFLQESLEHYQRMIDLGTNTVVTRAQHAFALTAAGNLMIDLGQSSSEAANYLQRAQQAIDALPKSEQESELLLRASADAHNGLGILARNRGELQEALESFRRAAAVRSTWVSVAPANLEAKRKLANALMNEGLVLAAQLEFADAEARQRDAQEIRRKIIDDGGGNAKVRRDFAKAEFNLAFVELRNGNSAAVLARLHQATTTFQALAEETPNDANLWKLLEESRITEAELSVELGGPQAYSDALSMLNDAFDDLSSLVQLTKNTPSACLSLIQLQQQGLETLLKIQNRQELPEIWQEPQAEHIAVNIEQMLQDVAQVMDVGRLDEIQQVGWLSIRVNSMRQRAVLLDAAGNRQAALDNILAALELCKQAVGHPFAEQRVASEISRLESLRTLLLEATVQ